jgi:GTP-binding protein
VALPIVAIVGRPNVGKSSLFNALANRRIAIVDPTAGVTRDRVAAPIELESGFFELIDTGGMGNEDEDNLTALIEGQITQAINQASLILFVVDIRAGVTPLDEHVSERLRGANKPVILVANKCDTPRVEAQMPELYSLGWGTPMCVSAQHRRGRNELFDAIRDNLPDLSAEPPPADVRMKLAIVGRRNTGKSTFINSLAKQERMIVSEVAGTTRDSVDVYFESDGHRFMAIDTAGVRRKKSLASDVEFYSLARAERSIRRADVVLLFLDAQLKISKVDKKLAEYILEENKPAIFVVNKWDLLAPLPTGEFATYLRKTFPSLEHVPIAFITAKEGRNVHALLNLAQTLHKQSSRRIGTGDLNRVLRETMEANPPPMRFNRRPKVNYATQVATNPPTLVLFTNGPELFDDSYRRYLIKAFRDKFDFAEIAIKLYIRRKTRGDAPPGVMENEDPAASREEARINGNPRDGRELRQPEKRGPRRGPNKVEAPPRVRTGKGKGKVPANKRKSAAPPVKGKAKSRPRAGEQPKSKRAGRPDTGLWQDL